MITDKELALYKRLTGRRKTSAPVRYTPRPVDADYQVGEIKRYFARQTNNVGGEIVEISKGQYDVLKTDVLYNVVEMRWLISGQIEDTIDAETEEIVRVGVKNSNLTSIRLATEKISGIKKKLNNPLQFYRAS